MENKKVVLSFTMSILLVATIMLVGFTFAYYRTRIIGNESTEPSVSVTSKKLEVKYSDDKSTIMATDIGLGWSATKEFSVENTGDETVNYNIILDKVQNDFELEGWFYDLEQVMSDGTKEFITPGVISTDDVQLVESNISIDSGEKHNYVINFYYQDTDTNQSDDMGKSLKLRVNIEETLTVPDVPTVPENITVNYYTNYPANNYVMLSETVEYGNDYTISNIIPERGDLYTFIGWSQDFNCEESKSAIMTSGSILQNVQNDINLYDCWSVQTG